MKATQNRINRRTIGYLAAPALAAVIGLGAHLASADTVSPQSTSVTVSSSNVKFTLGGATVTCTGASSTGITAASSTSPGVPVCDQISPPVFTGCRGSISGISFTASISTNQTNGLWMHCLGAPATAQLVIPAGGLVATATILGVNCRATAGAGTASGTWSNSTSSASFNTSVPVTTSGGFPCPSATSSNFMATFTTNPALTVTNP